MPLASRRAARTPPPGRYKATLAKRVGGVVTPLAEPVEFQVKYVGPSPLPAEDQKQLAEFQKQVVKLQRDLTTAIAAAGEITTRLEAIKTALDLTPNAPPESRDTVRKLIAPTARRFASSPATRS